MISIFNTHHSYLEQLLEHRLLGSNPEVLDSGSLGWALRTCISSKFPGDADVAGPGITSKHCWHRPPYKCVPWTCCLSIPQECGGNAEPQTHPSTQNQNMHFNKAPPTRGFLRLAELSSIGPEQWFPNFRCYVAVSGCDKQCLIRLTCASETHCLVCMPSCAFEGSFYLCLSCPCSPPSSLSPDQSPSLCMFLLLRS